MSNIASQTVFALSDKQFVEMGITLAGYKNIWLALFADVGVSILAILNSMRLLRKMKNKTRDLYV